MKKLFMLVCAMMFVVGCSSNEKNQPESLADGILTVGMECDYSPYNWTTTDQLKGDEAYQIFDSTSYCEGYDVEIAKRMAEELNVTLEIKKISWDGLIPALKSSQIDAIIAGMSPTEERKQSISFSDAYYKDNPKQILIVNKNSKYAKSQTLNDFEGARITAQQGTLQVGLLKQIAGLQETAALPDYVSLIQALNAQTIDGYIAEFAVATEHVSVNKDFVMINFSPENDFVLAESDTTTAIGIRKDDQQLQSALNEALAKIGDDERVNIMNKYIERTKGME